MTIQNKWISNFYFSSQKIVIIVIEQDDRMKTS